MKRYPIVGRNMYLGGLGEGRARKLPLCAKGEIPLQRLRVVPVNCRGASSVLIRSAKDVAELLREHVAPAPQEMVFVLPISSGNGVMGLVELHLGGASFSVVDPKLVFGVVLTTGAPAFIMVHNHPSGSTAPSAQDDTLTQQVKSGATLLNISLLDHIIVSGKGYYSYMENGRMPR